MPASAQRFVTRQCYAATLGGCAGPLNREHFISKNLLKDFAHGGMLKVSRAPNDDPANELVRSVNSLVARVLCKGHNSELSNVDTEGGKFVRAFYEAHNDLLSGSIIADRVDSCDGLLVQRWLLKYACGLLASGQAEFATEPIQRGAPPSDLLHLLFGLSPFPDGWGLYSFPTAPIGYSDRKQLGLGLYLPTNEVGVRTLAGVKMLHHGFTSILALRAPRMPLTGSDLDGATFHPEFFRFHYPATGRRVAVTLSWPVMRGNGFALEMHAGAPP